MKPITFLSTKSRGLSPDLRITKDYLADRIDNVEFCYFTSNENIENRMVKKGIQSAKKELCRKIGDVICIDGSLPVKLEKTAMDGKRILISAPYEYQFKAMNILQENSKVSKKKTFSSFTHVITGSEFGKELLERYYKLSDDVQMYDVCTPLAWDIHQENRIQQKLDKYSFYFPYMKGKKILSIILNGRGENNPFETFDWKAFFEVLGKEWFVFTNSAAAMENLVHLEAEYCESFGYVNRMLDARELLFFSDALVTNSGMYASYFSSKQKPVYCIASKENSFEQYVRQNYPSLLIQDFNEMMDINPEEYRTEHERFGKYFSYAPTVNPCEQIVKILEQR